MKKRGKRGLSKLQKINLILVLLMIIIVTLPVFILPKFIGYVVKEQKKQVQFYFYDETNCSLNGYVFSGNKLIGKAENGYFNLTYSNYKENFKIDKNISIFGKLGSCFDSELLFDKYWKAFPIAEYYFAGETVFNFKTKIQLNNPTRRELLAFIQPQKVNSELNRIPIKNSTLDDLSEINKYLNNKVNYAKDWDFNKEVNYWQTPSETLTVKRGDCEDFSTTFLSLVLAYNSSLNCYNIIFSSHVTTFCQIGSYYIYYDQQRTELKRQIKDKSNEEETKSKLRELKKDYFDNYGLTSQNKTRAYYAFNDNQFIEFKDNEDFIDWQYSLDKKPKIDLFSTFEQEATEIEKKYPAFAKVELRTQKLTELPTLKGFFIENFLIILILGIIFIILLVVLIKVNIRK